MSLTGLCWLAFAPRPLLDVVYHSTLVLALAANKPLSRPRNELEGDNV